MRTMRNKLTPEQAVVDQVFGALQAALPDVDFTVYDVEGHAYILDFDDETSLLLQAEGYAPLAQEMAIGDLDR